MSGIAIMTALGVAETLVEQIPNFIAAGKSIVGLMSAAGTALTNAAPDGKVRPEDKAALDAVIVGLEDTLDAEVVKDGA